MKINGLELLSMEFVIDGNFDIIRATDNLKFKTILDVGVGNGSASKYFALKNKDVTSIGLKFDNYNIDKEAMYSLGINLIETSIENYKSTRKFDGIWASHVLEHTRNVGVVLDKFYNLLSKDGWLFIMVPPYKNNVVGGHITNGWNLGQLMYNLLLSGFDIKNGHYIKHGYNICAFVQKKEKESLELLSDFGDIDNTKSLWPLEVEEGFDGNLKSINWFSNFKNYSYLKNVISDLKESIVNLEAKNKALLLVQKQLKESMINLEEKNKGLVEYAENIENKFNYYKIKNLK